MNQDRAAQDIIELLLTLKDISIYQTEIGYELNIYYQYMIRPTSVDIIYRY